MFLRTYELDRFPIGPYYDEAAATILASDVASGRSLPIFITSYTGHEVLFYYLAALVMRLMGMSVLALRLTSALVGVATVLLTYVLARELFDDEPVVESHWLGLFAAALMATSFWHVSVSRYGYRAITLPLVQSLMLLALWRGLRLNQLEMDRRRGRILRADRLYVSFQPDRAGGVGNRAAAGARRRTKTVATAADATRRPGARRADCVCAAGHLFRHAPGNLFRADGTGLDSSRRGRHMAGDARPQHTARAGGLYVCAAIRMARFNLPNLPMFQGVLALAFYAGLIVIALRLTRPSGLLGRVRYALLIAWPLVMLIPTILSDPDRGPAQPARDRYHAAGLFCPCAGACRGVGIDAARAVALGTKQARDDTRWPRLLLVVTLGDERRQHIPELFRALGVPTAPVL